MEAFYESDNYENKNQSSRSYSMLRSSSNGRVFVIHVRGMEFET